MDELTGYIATSEKAFSIWYRQLKNSVVSSFKWVNLPKSVDPLFVERTLFENGQIIFFAIENNGVKNLVCSSGFGTSNINPYGIPYNRTVNMPNGFTAELSAENSVIIYNSVDKRGECERCKYYAKRIAEFDSIIEGNAISQRTPIILTASEDVDKLALENIYARYITGSPVIKISDSLNPESIKIMSLSTSFTGNQLKLLQKELIDEYMSANGIYHNVNKDRIVVDEIAIDNYDVSVNRNSKLLPRISGVELINDMFADILTDRIGVNMI